MTRLPIRHGDTTSSKADDAWFEQGPSLLFIDFKFGLEGYIRGGNIQGRDQTSSEFNLRFEHALNSLCWLFCNQDTTCLYNQEERKSKQWMGCSFPLVQ